MTPVMLDTGPLGKIVHPRGNREVADWLEGLLRARVKVILPEIADYELRRNLLLEGLSASLDRLDRMKSIVTYCPLNTSAILKAAELWAIARRRGRPTSDPKELDGDVILSAQALMEGAMVATENVRHFSLFVDARHWREIHEP